MRFILTTAGLCLVTLFGVYLVGPGVYPPGKGESPLVVMVILVPLAAYRAARAAFPKIGLFIYGAVACGVFEILYLEDTGNQMLIREASASAAMAMKIGYVLGPIAMGFACYEIGRRTAQRALLQKQSPATKSSNQGFDIS